MSKKWGTEGVNVVQININGMECTSDGISKQIMKFTDKGMKLKTILLSYVTQTQKKTNASCSASYVETVFDSLNFMFNLDFL